MTELIVLAAPLGIAQDLVGFVDLLELLIGIGAVIAVGVILEGELPKGLADLFLGRVPRYPEHLVVVALRWHLPSSSAATGSSNAGSQYIVADLRTRQQGFSQAMTPLPGGDWPFARRAGMSGNWGGRVCGYGASEGTIRSRAANAPRRTEQTDR